MCLPLTDYPLPAVARLSESGSAPDCPCRRTCRLTLEEDDELAHDLFDECGSAELE